ncbi:MAG: 2-C-methyl-D-erythritol 4-phosphate cytidylyltransferase [Aeromicrobium sp.]|uniref:2-C-methyl-D-erythritol 4-phosphate cytidylyltransferase n=1 Tax=Aeromicrobium sp. TaxID=1871063 RepID=UPI0039E50BA6
MTVHALVLAGGVGERFGSGQPKQLSLLAGRSVLAHSVAAFADSPLIDQVVIVTGEGSRAEAERIAQGEPKVAAVVAGGATRAESTRQGLAAVPDDEDALVLVHDAARPLVSAEVIARVVAALDDYDAVTVGVDCVDTTVEVDAGGRIVATPDRARLRRVQTPQGFRAGLLRRAHAAVAAAHTDDCSVVRAAFPETPILVVPGDEDNLKITRAGDLAVAERVLQRREAAHV